jgi:aspartyl-tRNA(Asn)/glutamyl-tRNA(Gln) amidotransferase subunit B
VADLEAVIGLEIHVQLSTRTKMFCGCALSFGDEPNVHTCPICLAHPGVLPVPNEEAIRYALKIGLALGCEIAPRSIFHRKNYFYPDSPKAYQISQHDIPICSGGSLGEVRIHRAHLEEDAAKTIHVGESGRIHGSDTSLVDFNRGGTPLVEIVTEPDLRSAAEAAAWARLLRETVRQLGVSDVNMEEGSLRVDANVSVRPAGSEALGTKTELKNMNSFRFLERGIEAELTRQQEVVEGDGQVVQETLHFDPRTGDLTPLRSKEEAHDYRYFPEPDLVPLAPTEAMIREAREALPELPAARAARYREEMGLAEDVATLLAADPDTAGYFEEAARSAGGAEPKAVANWVTGELAAALREDGAAAEGGAAASKVKPAALGALVTMVAERRVSHGAAKTVLAALVAEGGDPEAIVEREGLAQMSADGGELEEIVAAAVEANPEAAEQVRAGNPKAIGAIVGHVMRETKGRADGGEVNRLIKAKLDAAD